MISFIGAALRDVGRETFSHGIYRARKGKLRKTRLGSLSKSPCPSSFTAALVCLQVNWVQAGGKGSLESVKGLRDRWFLETVC